MPDRPNVGMQWIQNLCSDEGVIHALHLYAYGIAVRLPQGKIPDQAHVQAHQVQALKTLRHGLERSKYSQSLADINTLLAAYSFYTGQKEEWKMHTRGAKEVTLKMGGMAKLDPCYQKVRLLSGPIVYGRNLVTPSFPSTDFESMAPKDDPVLKHYGFNFHMSAPPVKNLDLQALFKEHKEYLAVYHRYRTQFGFAAQHPVQTWLDIRFHILKLISLETYFEIRNSDAADDQASSKQINGMLVLALSYGHQFIYHHTRTPSGLLGETPVLVPLSTIPFVHLKNHLQIVLDSSGRDLMKYYTSIMWALFVLACHEHVDSIRTNDMTGLWAASEFKSVVQNLPREQRSLEWMKSIFNEYLYDEALDSFLVGMYS